MTDEELSELAECLQDACIEAQSNGRRIVGTDLPAARLSTSSCPFGALTGQRYPLPFAPSVLGRIPDESVVRAFMHGFDAHHIERDDDCRAFELGRLFREQYL